MAEAENEPDWTTEIDSKYRLVLLAARRSKQLQRGAKPRIYSSAKKTTRVALEGRVTTPVVRPSGGGSIDFSLCPMEIRSRGARHRLKSMLPPPQGRTTNRLG